MGTVDLSAPRQGFKGQYQIQITSNETGNLFVNGAGNLTIAEIICGLELFKKTLLDKGQGSGVLGFNPKRF